MVLPMGLVGIGGGAALHSLGFFAGTAAVDVKFAVQMRGVCVLPSRRANVHIMKDVAFVKGFCRRGRGTTGSTVEIGGLYWRGAEMLILTPFVADVSRCCCSCNTESAAHGIDTASAATSRVIFEAAGEEEHEAAGRDGASREVPVDVVSSWWFWLRTAL